MGNGQEGMVFEVVRVADDRKNSASKINPFIEKFGLQKDEFLDDPSSFQNFNEFFYRKLKKARDLLILIQNP